MEGERPAGEFLPGPPPKTSKESKKTGARVLYNVACGAYRSHILFILPLFTVLLLHEGAECNYRTRPLRSQQRIKKRGLLPSSTLFLSPLSPLFDV